MTLTVLNPATELPIAELAQAGEGETDEAVARAKAAFPAWRDLAPQDRVRLLRTLAGLVEEHAEELSRIESENVGKPIAGARGEIGMVAQVFHYYAGAVDKHLGETIPAAGGVAATFREALGVVGLSDRIHHFPRQLSGGQEQRVTIARAIVSDPTFLLCDEPTGDLDRKSADEIMELILRLVKEYKKTVLMVTHDPVVAARADVTLHLEKGVLVEADRLQTVSSGGVR